MRGRETYVAASGGALTCSAEAADRFYGHHIVDQLIPLSSFILFYFSYNKFIFFDEITGLGWKPFKIHQEHQYQQSPFMKGKSTNYE